MIQNITTYLNFPFPNYQTKEWNDSFITSCLVYRYLHEKYLKKNTGYEFDFVHIKGWIG